MDGESEPGWIAFSITDTHSFCESFIENTIVEFFNTSVSKEVSGYE
jgi:hypothetical protein